MTHTSKSAAVLLGLFGLVFATFGVLGASAMLFGAPGKVHGNTTVGIAISLIFAMVGAGIMYAAIYGSRKVAEQASVQQANPGSPWLWRQDWAARRAESKNRDSAIGLWVAAVFWNAISITGGVVGVPKLLGDLNPKVFLPLAFCLVGVILAGLAVRATIRRQRFGGTYFEFSVLPFSPGTALRGAIHLRFNTTATHGVDLRLSCVRRMTSGSGKNRSTTQIILWQDEKNAPQEALLQGPMGDGVIPVDINIPSDAYETNLEHPSDQVLWLLHAQGDVPGVDYADDFEVPVFRVTSASAFGTSQSVFAGSPAQIAGPAFQNDASDVTTPQNAKVVVSTATNGGTTFYFPPFRNPLRVFLLLLLTVAFVGVVYILHYSKAPWFFQAVFGLFDSLFFYGLIQLAFGSFHIEAGDGRILFRRALLGMGRTREFRFSDIAEILPVTTAQQGTDPDSASYAIRLQVKSGRKITLADAIDNRQEARWVVFQLEKLVGLKLDTHVAIDNPFRNYGPPPQRSAASSGR